MRPLAPVVLLLAGIVAACGGDPQRPRPVPVRTIGCQNVILSVRSGTQDGYRVILGGAVSVPPAYIPQVVRTHDRAWPFWEKAGLVVRAGRGPVDVSVSREARRRAAIGWGDAARPGSALRIAPCPGRSWNAYAGGFFLKARRACVPLLFRAGGRTATVMFGLRKRCPQP